MSKRPPANGIGRNVFLPTNVDIPGPGEYNPSAAAPGSYRKYGFLSKAERFPESDKDEQGVSSSDPFFNHEKSSKSDLSSFRLTTGIGKSVAKSLFNRPKPSPRIYTSSVLQTPRINPTLNSSEKRKLTLLDHDKSAKKNRVQLANKTNELLKIKKEFDDINKKLQKENEERHNLQLQHLDKKYMELLTIQTNDNEQEKELNRQLTKRISEFENDFSIIQAQIEDVLLEKQTVEDTCSQLESSLADSNQTLADLKLKIDDLGSVIKSKASENNKLQLQFNSQAIQNSILTKQISSIENSLNSKINDISASLESEKIKSENLEHSLQLEKSRASAQLSQDIKDFESKKNNEILIQTQNLATLHANELNECITKYESLLAEKTSIQEKNNEINVSLSYKVSLLEAEIDTLKAASTLESQKLQNEIDAQKKSVQEALESKSTLESTNESLEITVADIIYKTQLLENESNQKSLKLKDLNDQNDLLTKELYSAQNTLQNTQAEASEIKEQLNQTLNQYKEYETITQTKMDEKDQTIITLETQLDEKDNHNNQRLVEFEKQLDEYQIFVDDLETSKNALELKNKEMQQSLNSISDNLDLERKNFETKLLHLENEKKSLHVEINTKSKDISELKEKNDQENAKILELEKQVDELELVNKSRDWETLAQFIRKLCDNFNVNKDIELKSQISQLLLVIDEQTKSVMCINDYKNLARDTMHQLESYKEQYTIIRQALVNAEQDMSDMQQTISNIELGEGNQYKFLGLLAGCFNYQQAYLKKNHFDVFEELESTLFEYCTLNKVFKNSDLLDIAKISPYNKELDWSSLTSSLISSIPESLQLTTSDMLKLHLQSILTMLSVEQKQIADNTDEQLVNIALNKESASKPQKINFIDTLKHKNEHLTNQNKVLEKSVQVLTTKLVNLEREFLSYKEVWFEQP
ncbi:hypothetical protein BB561_003991 [Smittium simulii]|uniref:Uncharacterized protein n=1 Tax=Smittium simulii TaxID=133385 RepID=A0A2T9YIL7_9FUNG|nr:hypothetical protein BB561_003991 [Smittium simulii]